MAAPKGNKFWELRSSHGNAPKFDDPEVLWNACVEYFEWVDDNPLKETKLFHYQGEIIEHEVPKMRAMTVGGLCNFLDISYATWYTYTEKPHLTEVVRKARAIISQQKFEGAAADLLNPIIIARDLGLADKKDHSSTDGTMTPPETIRLVAVNDDGG